jgi:putative phosphoesterase
MRIAVLADTHDRAPLDLYPLFAEADEIWHLGDVTRVSLIDGLKALGPPVRVVRGNCDAVSAWPLEVELELQGLRVHLVHIPPRHPPPGVDLLLHGHTHVPRDEMVGGTRFLNPGCITRPNRGAPASYAWLTLEKGRRPMWKIMPARKS